VIQFTEKFADLRFPLDGSVRLDFSAGYGCEDPSRSAVLAPFIESSSGQFDFD
jgi:hypothetical protein